MRGKRTRQPRSKSKAYFRKTSMPHRKNLPKLVARGGIVL